MKTVFVNIEPGGLRKEITPISNINFELFPINERETAELRGKPGAGGLWTTDDGHSWINHVIENNISYKYPDNNIWELNELVVLPSTRIYVIDSIGDYLELTTKYTLQTYGIHTFLDWEKIADEWNAVQLTDKGQKETYPFLYGWELPQTLWFRWSFEDNWVVKHMKNM